MGGKSSKSKKTSAQSPKGSGGGSAVKLQLPPKKIKKESPYDLQYFVFLGGQVVEEFVEVPREAVVAATPKDGLTPPKPLADMTAEERQAWDAEVEKHEKKLKMQSLMEKNLQQKLKHGDKPIEPPVAGGLMGKAKKKMQQAQEKVANKAEELSKPTVTVEERVKKQAMAGAQGSLTGGATAALGQDIAKSQQMKDLEKKRKEFSKQEEDKKKKEEEERKKKEEEKKKNKPKGLNDFLQQVEGSEASPSSLSSGSNAPRESTGAKLRAFLSSAEGPAADSTAPAAAAQQPASSTESATEKANRLQAFLSATPDAAATETPSAAAPILDEESQAEPESKLANFLGASVRRVTFNPAAPGERVYEPEAPQDELMETVQEDENVDQGNAKDDKSDVQPKEETAAVSEAQAERPKSISGFIGATIRRLSHRASTTAKKDEAAAVPAESSQVVEAASDANKDEKAAPESDVPAESTKGPEASADGVEAAGNDTVVTAE